MSMDFDAEPLAGTLTTEQICTLLIGWKQVNCVSEKAFEQLLAVVKLFVRTTNFPGSLFQFNKMFEDLKLVNYKKLEVCKHCTHPILGADICPTCGVTVANREKTTNFIIEMDVEEQLQTICSRNGVLQSIQKYKKKKTLGYSDISDGSVYKRQPWLKDGLNISFTMNTDGIPVFHSSHTSMWPVFLVINELPFVERMKTKNAIVAGLWYGDAKPNNYFLRGLAAQLQKLYYEGFMVGDKNIRAALVCCTADSPARALVMSMKQYNGNHGCGSCYMKGENANSVHFYPYAPQDMVPRTEQSTRMDLETVIKDNLWEKGFNGIKNVPQLMDVPGFDIIQSMSKDYMHCVLLGVTSTLASAWLDNANSNEKFYLGNDRDMIDEALLNFKPPSYICRLPRSLTERGKWKASEWKAWLLYYSPIILEKQLDKQYYEHYLFLVQSVWLLLQQEISEADVCRAETQLEYFVYAHGALYGEEKCVSNIHTLLHLGETVRNLGPLWANSCFPFEDLNGKVKDCISGTTSFGMQVVRDVCIFQRLPACAHRIFAGHKDAENVFGEVVNKEKKRQQVFEVSEGMFAIGGLKENPSLTEEDYQIISPLRGNKRLGSYNRLMKCGSVIQARSYSRAGKQDNSVVALTDGTVAEVKEFLQFGEGQNATHWALVNQYSNPSEKQLYTVRNQALEATVEHIKIYAPGSLLRVVAIQEIQEKVMRYKEDGLTFIIKFPNTIEFE